MSVNLKTHGGEHIPNTNKKANNITLHYSKGGNAFSKFISV